MKVTDLDFPRLQFVGHVRRGRVYRLSTTHKAVEVYVSDGGRSIRLWDDAKGRELK